VETVDPERDEAAPDKGYPGPAPLAFVEKLFLRIASICVVILGTVILVKIIGRVFRFPAVPDDIVISGELMVILVALPWAYVTADRGHVSVEVFTDWMSPRAHRILAVFGGIVGLMMIAPLAWATGTAFVTAFNFGSYFDGELYLPQWPGRLAFFVGFALMLVRLVVLIVTDFRGVARKIRHYEDESF